MVRMIDEKGKRYGRLVVLRRANKPVDKRVCWVCRCGCGEHTTVRGSHLRSGQTRSCGCLMRERVATLSLLPKGEASFNAMLNSMTYAAKSRNLEWKLAEEQVRHLTKQVCHYCGAEPSQSCGKGRLNGLYLYNGLDRIDNLKGYTIDNVVPCCKACNRAKDVLTVEEFRSWIGRIYERFTGLV